MIRIGTIAIIVEAIPAEVYFTAIREKDTPRKGPKNDPIVIAFIPCAFCNAERTVFHRPEIDIIRINPTMPVIIRICVEGKGL